jgi:hypothetical protein
MSRNKSPDTARKLLLTLSEEDFMKLADLIARDDRAGEKFPARLDVIRRLIREAWDREVGVGRE